MPGQPYDAADLTWMRDTAAEHLPHVGAVYEPTKTPDGKGGRTVEYADDPDRTVACRLAPLTSRQRIQMEGVIRSPETEVLSLPYGTSLPKDTLVVIPDVGTVLVYVLPAPGNLSTLALALCERVDR